MMGGDVYDAPCKGCAERHPLCWDGCQRYTEYKAACKAYRDARSRTFALPMYYHCKVEEMILKRKHKRKEHFR